MAEEETIDIEIVEEGEIYLSDYFRPIVIIPDHLEIAVKWEGCIQRGRWEINDREQVRPLLSHTIPYLKPDMRELAKIAVEMIDKAIAKGEDELDRLYRLAKLFKSQKKGKEG